MVTKTNTPKLLDVMARHQVYLEGLKAGYRDDFTKVMLELRRDIRGVILDLEVDDLSRLTRRQLQTFINKLKTVQKRHYSRYTRLLLEDLRKFMDADLQMHADIMDETQERNKKAFAALLLLLSVPRRKRLWALIIGAPLAANGEIMEEYIKRFTSVGAAGLEAAVRRAYANRLSVPAMARTIVGRAAMGYRDGLLHRQALQANGIIATALQHTAAQVNQAALSVFYGQYRWVSVLDSRTSEVCRDRHNNIYDYDSGPLPPAHPNCRSTVVPVEPDDEEAPTSYHAWAKEQPDEVQDDILGSERAVRLRGGELKASDLPRFDGVSSLTLDEFKAKLGLMLAV